MPRKYPVPTLEEQALSNATKLLFNSAENMAKSIGIMSVIDPQLANAKMIVMMQQIKEVVNSIVSPQLRHKISLQCFMIKKKNYGVPCINCFYNYELMLKLAEAIFDARYMKVISSWNLYTSSAQNILFKHLSCMNKLQVLNISDSINAFEPHFVEDLTRSLGNMPNLEEFTLWNSCTDSIIATVAFNCKMIRFINVSRSEKVTNACISDLLLCINLKNVNLYDTSVNKVGFKNLFIQHPCLEHINLTYLFTLDGLLLMKTDISHDSESLGEFMIRPNIFRLTIPCDFSNNNLRLLSLCPNVKDVKICEYNYRNNYHALYDILKVKGYMIKSLFFAHGIINLNSIIDICQFCPFIETLHFFSCEVLYNEAENEYFRKFKVTPPLQLVKRLEIINRNRNGSASSSVKLFTFLVPYCTNIKSIYLDIHSPNLDDKTMADILLLNPMKQLEALRIDHARYLSMSTVQLLMEHCDNLRYLPYSDWKLSFEQKESFEEWLKINNIDLIVFDTYEDHIRYNASCSYMRCNRCENLYHSRSHRTFF